MPDDRNPEHIPAPSPVELIEQLGFDEVTALSALLKGKWKTVANQEYRMRRRDLGRLRTFIPDGLEAPEFAAEEAETYLDTARQVTRANALRVEGSKFAYEKSVIAHAANAYVTRPDTRVRLGLRTGYTDPGSASKFFASNLYRLTITAREVAVRTFQARRNSILRANFTGVPLADSEVFLDYVQAQPITREQIGRAKEEVGRLRYRAPYPDFFQLPQADRDVIVTTLGKEWEELYVLLFTHYPGQFERQATFAASPLAYLPVRALREAIATSPAVPPIRICQAFMRHPERFPARLEELRRDAQYREAVSKFSAAQAQERHETTQGGEGIVLSKNQQEIQKLLAESGVRPEVADMSFGTTVLLTDPATESYGPQLIYRTQLESIIDKNLQLLGRSLYEGLPGHNPKGVTLSRWSVFNVGERLHAGFSGAMSDLTMTLLPVSQEELDARLAEMEHQVKKPPQAQDVYEVVFTVNMRSSGRAAETALLRLMLVVRSDTPRDTIAKSGWRSRSTGADLVANLREESRSRAHRLEVYYRRNALSAGAPELGRRQ